MSETQLFLIRVWQHLGQFRASVRWVGAEAPCLFTEPEAVGEFLRRAALSPAGASPEREPDVRTGECASDRRTG